MPHLTRQDLLPGKPDLSCAPKVPDPLPDYVSRLPRQKVFSSRRIARLFPCPPSPAMPNSSAPGKEAFCPFWTPKKSDFMYSFFPMVLRPEKYAIVPQKKRLSLLTRRFH